MRLTEEEIAAITAAARDAFGASAVVRLFGSRVYDHLRGGDIGYRDGVVLKDPAHPHPAALTRLAPLPPGEGKSSAAAKG